MRKLILLTALLLPSLAAAQGSRLDGVVQGLNGPLPNQFVAVCLQPANITTTPCSTLATLYTDITLTTPAANPVQSDSFGNFHFYAAGGLYTLQTFGPQVQTPYVQRDIILPCAPSACYFTALIHNSADVASTGTVRLEHGDTICWRNFTNSADLCLSVNNSNAIQFPGGFGGGGGGTTLTVNSVSPGAAADLNNTTPAAGANFLNAQWQVTPGSVSAEIPVTGNGTKVISGTGSYTVGHCYQVDASGNAVDSGAACGGSGATLSAQTTCNLGGNITGIGATTLTTIVTCATTAPSSGCPCRAFVSWTIAGLGTSSTQQVTGYITDGTVNYAGTSGNIDNQVTNGEKSVARSAFSTVRYNNGASVTFTLKAESDHTWDARAVTSFGSLPTQVQVNYIPSN